MSNKNFLNPTAGVFQNQTKTVTFTPNPREAEDNNFAALNSQRQSKIKIQIRDFANGKGDSAIISSVNIDYKKVLAWYEAVKASIYMGQVPYQLSETKVISDPLPQNSKYPGKCRVTKLSISMKSSHNDTFRWYIAIENGFAFSKGRNGSRIADNSSYVKESGGFVYIDKEDILMYLRDCIRFIDYSAYHNFTTSYVEKKERYDIMIQNTGYYNNQNNIPSSPTTDAFQQTNEVQPEPVAEPVVQIPTKTFTLQIVSDPTYENGETVCDAICNGHSVHLYFAQGQVVPPEILESKQKGYAVVVELNIINKKAYFHSFV